MPAANVDRRVRGPVLKLSPGHASTPCLPVPFSFLRCQWYCLRLDVSTFEFQWQRCSPRGLFNSGTECLNYWDVTDARIPDIRGPLHLHPSLSRRKLSVAALQRSSSSRMWSALWPWLHFNCVSKIPKSKSSEQQKKAPFLLNKHTAGPWIWTRHPAIRRMI